LCKCFEGDSMIFLKNELKNRFRKIKRIKPDASRSTSKECYILGIDKI
jgi:23S rRNA U2552 (ribose-2'-O)-methylase RlmE/FtsJ